MNQEKGHREEDTFHTLHDTPQSGVGEAWHTMAQAGGAAAVVQITRAAPATTATHVTGEKPGGMDLVIQRKVNEGEPLWKKNQLVF